MRSNWWTRERVVAAMRTWSEEYGRPPRSYEWSPATALSGGFIGPCEVTRWQREYPRFPSAALVADRFGTFSEGLRAAGLPARIPAKELPVAERVHAACRMRAEGYSVPAIADALAVSVGTVYSYLRAKACVDCGGPTTGGKSGRCRKCEGVARRKPIDRETVIARLREWHQRFGEPPMMRDWEPRRDGNQPSAWHCERPYWPTVGDTQRLFGSWTAGLAAAGLAVRRRPWDKAGLVEALQRWAKHHGRSPRFADWQHAGESHPDASTVQAHFGSWNAGLRAAGLLVTAPPHARLGALSPEERSRRRRQLQQQRAEARRRRQGVPPLLPREVA